MATLYKNQKREKGIGPPQMTNLSISTNSEPFEPWPVAPVTRRTPLTRSATSTKASHPQSTKLPKYIGGKDRSKDKLAIKKIRDR